MNGVGDFRGDRLVEGDRTGVTLDRVVLLFALTLHLLAFNLFALALLPFSMGHLFLSVALQDFPLPGVPLALGVEGLGRRMLHGLTDARKGVASGVRRTRRMRTIRRRLV